MCWRKIQRVYKRNETSEKMEDRFLLRLLGEYIRTPPLSLIMIISDDTHISKSVKTKLRTVEKLYSPSNFLTLPTLSVS